MQKESKDCLGQGICSVTDIVNKCSADDPDLYQEEKDFDDDMKNAVNRSVYLGRKPLERILVL